MISRNVCPLNIRLIHHGHNASTPDGGRLRGHDQYMCGGAAREQIVSPGRLEAKGRSYEDNALESYPGGALVEPAIQY